MIREVRCEINYKIWNKMPKAIRFGPHPLFQWLTFRVRQRPPRIRLAFGEVEAAVGPRTPFLVSLPLNILMIYIGSGQLHDEAGITPPFARKYRIQGCKRAGLRQ